MEYTVKDYESKLSERETQKAIKMIKDEFQVRLAKALHLDRVTAPIMVEAGKGINDDLNGVERKVEFTIHAMDEAGAEVVQSLAKWKRVQLARLQYGPMEGIYTDMNAIRRDDSMDNLHSIFVDQWDWEMVIDRKNRNRRFLKSTVKKIVNVLYAVDQKLCKTYPQLSPVVSREVFFITAQELENLYPNLSPKERENRIVREYKTVFLMQIGKKLHSGIPHDGRAPDYDDWGLNGDILVWNPVLNCAFEISSMGIRVDEKSLPRQLKAAHAMDRMQYTYHRSIAEGKYPLTIGGGIGQSRICMLLLEKAHIGEVQCAIWPQDMRDRLAEENITLL